MTAADAPELTSMFVAFPAVNIRCNSTLTTTSEGIAMSAYQVSLLKWVQSLSDEQLAEYLNSEGFTDAEFDALVFEDIKRMTIKEI